MSTPTNTDIKILHQWEVTVNKTVDETTTETRNGQPVTLTQKVVKPVSTKMALKQPTRRELRAAELFYGREYSRFIQLGFITESILRNKMIDMSGGVISEKERDRANKLSQRLVALEMDLARLATQKEVLEETKKIQNEIVSIRTELINLNAVKESAFSQSAESKAQSQLINWFACFLIYIDRAGKWVPYFEGESYEQKEEYMWKLEEAEDEFYAAAAPKIGTYVGWFSHGANTAEAFKAIDHEMGKQLAADKPVEETPANVVTEVASAETTDAPAPAAKPE